MAWAERARKTARQKALDAARKFSDTKYKISLISGRLDCSPVASATSFNMGIQHEALYCEEGSLGMRTLRAFWRRVARCFRARRDFAWSNSKTADRKTPANYACNDRRYESNFNGKFRARGVLRAATRGPQNDDFHILLWTWR